MASVSDDETIKIWVTETLAQKVGKEVEDDQEDYEQMEEDGEDVIYSKK